MTSPTPFVAPSTRPTIAFIGGGIAGLAGAIEALDLGAHVIVLDAHTLGGKLRTSAFAGRQLDEGPDAFLARVPDGVAFAQRVGLGDALVAPATGRAYLALDDGLVPLPASHVLGIPADPEAQDVAAVVGADGVAAMRADITHPGTRPDDHDESIGSFVRRRLGDAIADRLVGPLVGGINAGNIDELSLAAMAAPIDAIARSPKHASLVKAAASMRSGASTTGPIFQAPQSGMASLANAAVATLRASGAELVEHVNVRGLERLERGWRIVADDPRRVGASTDVTFVADAVVLAAPAGATATLIQDHAPNAGAMLGAIRHASVAIVALALREESVGVQLNGSGFLVPRTSGTLCTAASWASTKWAHLAAEHGDGTTIVRASAGRFDDRRISSIDDAELVAKVTEELAQMMQISEEPALTRLTRWPSALPQFTVGHLARVDAMEAELGQYAPTLGVAGCALRGVGIPASIASGRRAAQHVISALHESSIR